MVPWTKREDINNYIEFKNSILNKLHSQDKNLLNEEEITIEPVDPVKSPKKHTRHSSMDLANGSASITHVLEKCVSNGDGDAEEVKKGEEEVENVEGRRFWKEINKIECVYLWFRLFSSVYIIYTLLICKYNTIYFGMVH